MTYLYTANGQTAGYEPHAEANKTAAELKDWAQEHDLRVYECVPDDPQQMFGRTGNQTLYRVRGRGAKGKARYFSVSRNSYYFNKHPYYAKPSERHLLIPDAQREEDPCGDLENVEPLTNSIVPPDPGADMTGGSGADALYRVERDGRIRTTGRRGWFERTLRYYELGGKGPLLK